ncbi:hypothetical protein KJ980_04930 [Patescibacteria group bacterium]|nr:hypothetical protein [Patescibacteria group bacterium]MBU4017088.1 hypothetical protein [Patescibacteria group bacterium]MBU4098963.1 hypothetical protein [Patescibacteria group bacterium]
MKNINKPTKGQALIILLFFTLIAVTICSASVIILITNSLSGTKLQQGSIAYEIAKSGIENAKLQLLRNPDYYGETVTIGDGTAIIEVSSDNGIFTITSSGKIGNYLRKTQITAAYQNYELTFSSIKEVY